MDDEPERAEDLLGKWRAFVCAQIQVLVNQESLDLITKEQKICTHDNVGAEQEKLLVKQNTL